LVQDKGIAGAMVDYPFLCHVERSLELFTDGPYHELVHLWKRLPFAVQKHLRTLSYFDGMNIAPRISYPVLLSVGLLDTVCPPSTAFAVYNHLLSVEKQIAVYPYNGHEGGGAVHDEEKYRFVRRCLSQVENAAN
jgi:cephalosporin-C deacetylase